MLFKDAHKTIEEMLDKVDKNIKDEDLRDLMHKLLVEDYIKKLFIDMFLNIKKMEQLKKIN